MLNIGLIGITEVLEPHVKRIQKNKHVNVIGKASVGTSAQLNGFHFSIPEFNRVELIERADILLIDNSSLLPFDILCDIVKKSKHIFTTEYLNLTAEQCQQLEKLVNESGSVMQISNPYYYYPAIQWLNENIYTSVYLDISKYSNKADLRDNLYKLLLMLTCVNAVRTKKVGVISFDSTINEACFNNIRLEFGDSSVVNLTIGSHFPQAKFQIEGYSKEKFVSIDMEAGTAVLNNKDLPLSGFSPVSEFDEMIESILGNRSTKGNVDDYLNALQLVEKIEKKINQFYS